MSAGNMKVLFEEQRVLVGAKYTRNVFAHVRALLGKDAYNKRYLIIERSLEDSGETSHETIALWADNLARCNLLRHPATDSAAVRLAVSEANMYYYLACTKLLETFPKDEFTAPITFTRYTVDEYGVLHGKNEVVREGEPEEPAT